MQVYTPNELLVLLPLLEHSPAYVPHEVLYAHSYTAPEAITEARIEECRALLHEALADGSFEVEMRPIRNVISRVRLKLHTVGLDVLSLVEMGYVLCPRTRVRRSKRVGAQRPEQQQVG